MRTNVLAVFAVTSLAIMVLLFMVELIVYLIDPASLLVLLVSVLGWSLENQESITTAQKWGGLFVFNVSASIVGGLILMAFTSRK